LAKLDDEPSQVSFFGSNCTLALLPISAISGMSLPNSANVPPSFGATEAR
jgi:hypothetical protein